MRRIYFILFYLVLSCSCKAQKGFLKGLQKDVPVVVEGYLINLYGEYGVWIFQPCNDSSLSIMDAIRGQSFFVQDMANDLGYTNLKDIYGFGKKLPVVFYDVKEKIEINGDMQYLFCRLTINPIDAPAKEHQCDYTVYYNGLKKGLSCTFFTNYVVDLEPLDPEIRRKYLQLFYDKGWELPNWVKPKRS